MDNIKLIRLVSGEDIICQVEKLDNEDYKVVEPMSVMIKDTGRQTGLIMQHWLPVQIIETNEAVVKLRDVLTIVNVDESFAEYYLNTVNEMNKILKQKEIMDNMDDEEFEDVREIMEQMESMENLIIH